MHELGHSIGIKHEHQRPDREDYVDFHIENVNVNKTGNFDLLSWNKFEAFSVPYDYSSLWHYGFKVGL